jgi:hypothetical protein
MRMPFGRYKGHEIEALPDSYLEWLQTIAIAATPLRAAVEAEWRRRCAASARRSLPADLMPIAESLVSLGLRELTRRHHPDLAGGSTTVMQQVNLVADWLRTTIRGAA